jgi:hypothetical protein
VIGAVQNCDRIDVRRAIEELRNVSTPDAVYVEDGAADGLSCFRGPVESLYRSWSESLRVLTKLARSSSRVSMTIE